MSPALRLRAFFFLYYPRISVSGKGLITSGLRWGCGGRGGAGPWRPPGEEAPVGVGVCLGVCLLGVPCREVGSAPAFRADGSRGPGLPLPLRVVWPPTSRAWRPRHVPGPERLSSRSVGTKRPRLGPMTAPPTSSPAPKVRALPSPQGSAGTRAVTSPRASGHLLHCPRPPHPRLLPPPHTFVTPLVKRSCVHSLLNPLWPFWR